MAQLPFVVNEIQLLVRLWRHLAAGRRRQFRWLTGLVLLAALAEVASIGAVVPFLALLANADQLPRQEFLHTISLWLGTNSAEDLVLPLAALFVGAAILAGAIRLVLVWASTRLAFAAGADLGADIYQKALYQPYAIHCGRNSSEVIDAILVKAQAATHVVLYQAVTGLASLLMLLVIFSAIVAIQPLAALGVLFSLGLLYFFITSITRSRLQANSRQIAEQSSRRLKILQEGLGAIRDILIHGLQKPYVEIFRKADHAVVRAESGNMVIGQSPRFVMEAMGMTIIGLLALGLSYRSGGVSEAIPVLGAIALGAQRMLPLVQQVYYGLSGLRGNSQSCEEVLRFLEQPVARPVRLDSAICISFERSIELVGVTFAYPESSQPVLNEVCIGVPIGAWVGIAGATGSGKSTLMDILMGLLVPSKGALFIDSVPITEETVTAWQVNIAHVPQSVFLLDATVAENIAIGENLPQINMERILRAAELACLDDTIEALPEKYLTVVGERGIRFSGGQRQRLGIARALYRNARVLFLDEATNALDVEMEARVMKGLATLGEKLTLFIVSHRPETLRWCGTIIDVNAGVVHVRTAGKDCFRTTSGPTPT